MKTILRLLSCLTIFTSVAPLTSNVKIKDIQIDNIKLKGAALQTSDIKINSQNIAQHNGIIVPLNYDYRVDGGITSFWTYDVSVITLFNYKQYANSWEEFEQKYPHFRLVNFVAKVSGQSSEWVTNTYGKDTKDLPWDKEGDRVVWMDSHPIFIGHQTASIYLRFREWNDVIMLVISYSTMSTNCLSHVWASLSTSEAIFYN